MKTTLQTIRILVTFFIIKNIRCQDGFSEQDFLRLQQYTMSNGQTEAVTNYNTNDIQRDQHVQYHMNDENSGDYSRADRSKGRKVYRIKNPFQNQLEEEKPSQDANIHDSGTGASNQYAAMQYSLPPEDFLQKMRAENQYQQQLSSQVSPSPYTATPQPQYQYSTLQPSNYDINQQSNQISTLESKAYTPVYQSNINSYQYSNPSLYNLDNTHSTPMPPYISTQLPNAQYLDTPANTYVSSSSPIYLSSPQNLQQYVSSPSTNTQVGTLDYNNNRVTTMGSNYDTSNELSKRMQIDHYDNAANGVRYPTHIQNQYQNEYTPSTASPTSSIYPDSLREAWQNSLNGGYKPDNGYSQTQFQNLKYSNNQRDNRQDTNFDTSNSETHRIGSMPSANNLFLNYVQPDYQLYSNIRSQARDSEPDASQVEGYSHGDYGWKLSEKKSSYEPEISTRNNFFKYQIQSLQPDTGAVSQVSFQMDSSKPYNYDQNTKPVTEKLETDEFVRAAAKAHERYKQQLEASKYLSNVHYNNNFETSANYNIDNSKQSNKVYNPNFYGNSPAESVTATPFYYINSRDTSDSKIKQPFDHDKALKNIVPIDVSNVVQNSDSSGKVTTDVENKYSFLGYSKDHPEQNLKHYIRPGDSFYGDKNSLYSIKTKPDEYITLDKLKQLEQNNYYGKHQTPEFYNLGSGNKRFVEELSHFAKQISNNQQLQDNTQSSANTNNQQGSQHSQITSDIANILKFNDIPYRLTQNIHTTTQQLRNNNFEGSIPTPLPVRINQNVDGHHLDVAAEILNKLMINKQNNFNTNRPDTELQSSNLLPTINGFKVANPYNVDLKLVADMLKGKPAVDDSQMTVLQELNKPSLPMKLDISQLQQFLQLKNENNAMGLNNGFNSLSNSLFDIYNSGRLPYQGVKYSRSEEEPENIPIADSSNSHPIGAVVEQEDALNEEVLSDTSESSDESSLSYDEERQKNALKSGNRGFGDRHRHSGTYTSRYSYKRKYPKSEFGEPYPLLKPPPPHSSRHRTLPKAEKSSRRRRITKPKMIRVFKTEPLFEADSSMSDDINPFSFKRSLTVAEEKSDTVNVEESA